MLLLIEVSDATLRFDRSEKASLYARHGIQELWIVDLPNRQVHRMREPDSGGYHSIASSSPPGTLRADAFPEVHIDLSALLP